MVGFVEAGRIDDIGCLDRVDKIRYGDAVRRKQSQIGCHAKLRHLPALYRYGTDAEYAIERRLQVVGGHLPELRLRNGIGGKAVAQNRKCGEGKAIGGDARGGRQRLSDFAESRVR